MLAIGLNLRDDRPCGWQRDYQSRVPPFVMAVGWAALLGTFVGLVSPFWRAESFIAEANAAITRRPPDFLRADAAYVKAFEADPYYARPWREDAALHLMVWQQEGEHRQNRQSLELENDPVSVRPGRSGSAQSERLGHAQRAGPCHQADAGVNRLKLEPLAAIRLRGELVKSTAHGQRTQPDKRRAARPTGLRER